MSSPHFSVVIPVFNRAEMLRDALRSVFAQEFKDYEVIVVDDGSTEDLSPVVSEFGNRVQLIRQANSGPGVARNTGVERARGEYIAFLDSDDVWFPWTLQVMADVIARCDRPSVIQGKGHWYSERPQASACPTRYKVFADYFASSRYNDWAGAGALVIGAKHFRSVAGFKVRLYVAEDLDLLMRLGDAAGFVLIEDPVTFGYRQHDGNSIRDLNSTIEGAMHLAKSEQAGIYPGGLSRATERLTILARFLRPPSLAAVSSGRYSQAWQLYRATLPWNLRLGRLKYLVGFPCMALTSHFCRRVTGGP